MQSQTAEQLAPKIAEHSPRYSIMRMVPVSEYAAKKAYLAGEILHLFPIPNVYPSNETPAPRSFMECETLAAYCNPKTYNGAIEGFKKRNGCAKIGFYLLHITQEEEDFE